MKTEYDLSRIKKLSEIREDRDIRQISHAIYPGFHCPLFASVMMASRIEDLAILVVGTEECTFYSRNLLFRTNPQQRNVFSLVLDKHDITFGCAHKLETAVGRIQAEEDCKALLVVGSCVIETIGEDLEAILDGLNHGKGCPILLVRTEHFTKDVPISGLCDTLSVLANVMESQPERPQTVNILGHRFDEFKNTELFRLLDAANIKTNAQIPSKCSIDEIRRAPSAALNIVTNFAALGLAKRMKEAFGVHYVNFANNMSPDSIKAAYGGIEERLNRSLGKAVDKLHRDLVGAKEALAESARGRTFVFASPPLYAFDLSWFFCDCGMVPLWIQAVGFRESDNVPVRNILSKGHDPRVSRALNQVPMDFICERFGPDYAFSHPPRRPAHNHGTRTISLMMEIRGIGFEVPLGMINRILQES